VVRNGKPAAVILDINEYQDMLERIEDAYDLKMLSQLRKKRLSFKRLDEVLRAHPSLV